MIFVKGDEMLINDLCIVHRETRLHEKNNKFNAITMKLTTQVLIRATPSNVWSVIIAFNTYPNWNPFIKSITGNVEVGKKMVAIIQPPGSKAMTFKPKVLSFVHHKELTWIGHLFFPGLFDGTHSFELVDNGDGTTTFIQSEVFAGILTPLFKLQLERNTKMGFEQMNNKLKELAESL